jgi:hypothetical protein
MTTPDTPSGYNDKLPRRRLPVWVWGVSACACLPIAAVILLGAALTPVFKRVREARRETESTNFCISNVKQIATSMQMYVQDYDDTYPASRNWMDGISPYLGNPNTDKTRNVLQCPTVRAVQPAGYGYAFNSALAGKSAAKINSPGRMPLVYDSSNLVKNASDAVSSLPNPARHRQRGIRGLKGQHVNTVSYADGHVKAQTTDGKAFIIPGTPNN